MIKVFLDLGIQVREIKNMPPMIFSVTDKEVLATIDKMEGEEMVHSVLASNESICVDYFRFMFEDLWIEGVDAKTRIANIEERIDFGGIEVIPNASRAAGLYLDLVRNAQDQIMIMFPTPFLRQSRIGAIQLAKEAAGERKVKVRILIPKHESTEHLVQTLINEEEQEQEKYSPAATAATIHSNLIHDNIDVRNIEQ